jgi:dCMP deaminase
LLDQITSIVEDLENANTRIGRDELFMGMAHLFRTRSTCVRGKVGAVLVMDKRVIATGYNGAPPGMPHCWELGCDVPANNHQAGCQRATHAEANVVAFAARHGTACQGSTLYCTHGPCRKCAQLVLSAGISELVYQIPYRLPEGLELLDAGLVTVRRLILR